MNREVWRNAIVVDTGASGRWTAKELYGSGVGIYSLTARAAHDAAEQFKAGKFS